MSAKIFLSIADSPIDSKLVVLTAKELRGISELAETRAFPKDAIIVEEGVRSEALYNICEGRVKVFVADPVGQETVLATNCTGEYFGRLGFDEGPFPATGKTVEPNRLTILSKNDLKALLVNHSRKFTKGTI